MVVCSGLITAGMLYGQARADVSSLKDDVASFKADHAVVIADHAIIPTIQQDVKEIKANQKSVSEKQDRQYESIMSTLQTIIVRRDSKS